MYVVVDGEGVRVVLEFETKHTKAMGVHVTILEAPKETCYEGFPVQLEVYKEE